MPKPRLYTLVLAIALTASAIVAFGMAGVIVAAVLLASVEFLRTGRSLHQVADKIVILLLALVILALLLPPIEEGRESARRSTCMNHLRGLALALQGYNDAHGSFPPAYVADKDGKPIHSWRVLILPYLGCWDLYEQYDFHEPWNGPHNRKLADKWPHEFVCPADDHAASNSATGYVAVVGPDTAWPGKASAKIGDFSHGGANTILLVEVADSGINWMEPRDLTLEEACRGIGKGNNPKISCPHYSDAGWFSSRKKIAIAAFADGRVHFLPEDIAAADVKSMLTRTSEKAVYLDRHQSRQLGRVEFAAMGVMLIAAFLLLIRRRYKGKEEAHPDEVRV